MKQFLLGLVMILTTFSATAQIRGTISDAETKEELTGATIMIKGTASGAFSGLDGTFTIDAKSGDVLIISYLGYTSQEITATNGVSVKLKPANKTLQEITVIASYAKDRKTPVAVSTIRAKQIEETYGGSQELPELLKVTPGVYATKTGGGVGDSRINIRGFDQRNIAVLVNGVPVNDMENGWVYWSNWAGLGDATSTMQVQRGLGASKLAINSVGGTMNIITKSTDAKPGSSIQFQTTDYGQSKVTAYASTGLSDKGWAFTTVLSKTKGDGYVDGTWVNAYSYFLSLSKQLGDKHKLVLTGIGAPQEHGQRSSGITQSDLDTYGRKYNKDMGYYADGTLYNDRINYYHKPQFTLNHYWDISDKTELSTSVYYSIGHGGGSGRLGSSFATTSNGLIDIQQAQDYNLANPNIRSGGVKYAQRNSVNNHKWLGVLSTLNHKINDNFEMTLGVDGRDYKGEHFREVRDLLGGSLYNDNTNGLVGVHANSSDYLNPFAVTPVNQRVSYDNDGLVKYIGGFGQLEYTNDKLSAFVTGAVNTTSNQRIDRMLYINNPNRGNESEVVNIMGYSAKAGANYNVNNKSNFYANVGTFSRAPFFSFVFVNNSNDVVQNLLNERALSFEAGYGFRIEKLAFKINAYSTQWNDKSLLSGNITGPNGTLTRALMSGANATHNGIELEFNTKPFKNFDFGGIVSLGDWKWNGDVQATVFSEIDPTQSTTVKSYVDGVHVGDAPQSQFGFKGRYQITKKLYVGAEYVYNARFYSNFDPSKKTTPESKIDSWQMPSYGTLDSRVGYDAKLFGKELSLAVQVFNVTDTLYWSDATDNGNGEMAYGFPGFGRNMNFSAKMRF